jgi:hypothetical protein
VKRDRFAVLSYDGFWFDLVCWSSVAKAMEDRRLGSVSIGVYR